MFDEEASSMNQLLQTKDDAVAKLSNELAEMRAMLKTAALIQANLQKDLNESRANEKANVVKFDETMKFIKNENVQLRDEFNMHKKLAEDRSEEVESIKTKALMLAEVQNELKTAKKERGSYEDKISALECENTDIREEVNSLQMTVGERVELIASLQKQLAEANERGRAGVIDNRDADAAQLHQDRIAARLEASQALEQLTQARAQAAVLEKKVEKAKSLHRKVEDRLKTVERDRQSCEEESKAFLSEATSEIAALKERNKAIETEFTQANATWKSLRDDKDKQATEMSENLEKVETLTKALAKAEEMLSGEKAQLLSAATEVVELKARLTEFEYAVSQLKGTNDTLREARGTQSAEVLSMATQMDELARSLKKSEEAANAEKTRTTAALKECDELKTVIIGNDKTISDLKSKQNHLADKLRDLMKKYAEAKASSQSLGQDKESELTSLRLKLENAERGGGDSRAMAAELADRYGETQRELSRTKMSIQEHLLTIESLQRDQRGFDAKLAAAVGEQNAALERLQTADAMRASLERRITELLEDRERVDDKLRSGEDSAKVLEEYKKRAQLALKKANTASSTAAAELAEMKRTVEEAKARAAEAEEALADKGRHWATVEAHLRSCQAEVAQLKRDLASSVEAEQVASRAAEQAIVRLRDANEALATRPELPASVNTGSSVQKGPPPDADCSSTVVAADEKQNDHSKDNVVARRLDDTVVDDTKTDATSNESSNGRYLGGQTDEEYDEEMPARRRKGQLRRGLVSGRQELPRGQENDTIEFGGGVSLAMKEPSSDKLMLVNELYTQIDELRREVAHRGVEIEVRRQELSIEVEAKRKLSARVDELMAFIDRSKKFQSNDPDSATNTEYLKNCVYRFMATSEHSERRRLAPVISTILKLTHAEKKTVETALIAESSTDFQGSLGLDQLTSFFGWGGGGTGVVNSIDASTQQQQQQQQQLPVPGLSLKRSANSN